MSMLQVMELEGVKHKKYVLQNAWTGIVIDKRFWTVRGARRHANRNVNSLNKTIRGLNKRYGKV
jgi:hypothetical protein